MNDVIIKLAFIGFGEAATAFVEGWREDVSLDGRAFDIRAYDIKTGSFSPDIRRKKWADYDALGVTGCENLAEALAGADVVFSLVTADQALVAAIGAACHIEKSAFYFDGNSCAPQTKRASAAELSTSGARYVDVAVMAPVYPARHRTPLLVSGADARDALHILTRMGMNATRAEGEIGAASSVKMMRSIMVKGMEALMLECILSARKAGVDAEVLASLEASDPEFGWGVRAGYMMERVMQHGERRAAEMREVAATVAQLGIDNAMARATVDWQQRVGALKFDATSGNYTQLADSILQKLDDKLE